MSSNAFNELITLLPFNMQQTARERGTNINSILSPVGEVIAQRDELLVRLSQSYEVLGNTVIELQARVKELENADT